MTNPIALTLLIMQLVAGPQHAQQPSQRTGGTAHAYTVGTATYYSPHLLERVAAKRGLRMGDAQGWATYPECSRIGGVIHVSVWNPVKKRWAAWTTRRIADCSQVKDFRRHTAEHLIELSYTDAVKYGYKAFGRTAIRYYLEGE